MKNEDPDNNGTGPFTEAMLAPKPPAGEGRVELDEETMNMCEWLIDRRTDLLMAHYADKDIPAWVTNLSGLITGIRDRLLFHAALKAEVGRLKNFARIANDNENIWKASAEKAEAELRDLRAFKERWQGVAEAVEKANIDHIKMDEHWTELTFTPCQSGGSISTMREPRISPASLSFFRGTSAPGGKDNIMCQPFSGIVLENGDVLWEFGMDSHEDLIAKHGLKDTTDRKDQLTFARFEITPDNKDYWTPDKWTFRLDERAKPTWWSGVHEDEAFKAHARWLKRLDKILVRKPVVDPRKVAPPKITQKHLALVKEWASLRASLGDSLWDSLWASLGDSLGASLGARLGASLGDSLGASLWDSLWASLWDSLRASLRASWYAYVGSFFNLPRSAWKHTEKIKTKGYPFQAAVTLWEMGLIPLTDGEKWYLVGGPDLKVLWSGTKKDMTARRKA